MKTTPDTNQIHDLRQLLKEAAPNHSKFCDTRPGGCKTYFLVHNDCPVTPDYFVAATVFHDRKVATERSETGAFAESGDMRCEESLTGKDFYLRWSYFGDDVVRVFIVSAPQPHCPTREERTKDQGTAYSLLASLAAASGCRAVFVSPLGKGYKGQRLPSVHDS